MEDNVREYFNHASEVIGGLYKKRFEEDVNEEIENYNIESPIEQLFFIGLKGVCCFNENMLTLLICPQAEIGKYRVDFMISCNEFEDIRLIVELDGHKFHDKDKEQRKYEKERDRFLQKAGFPIFHYTGSEIYKNPYPAAEEVINYFKGRIEFEGIG